MSTDETPMADGHDEAVETVDATTELPPPADFDLDGWISGLAATERSATIYQRADLLAKIDELSGAVDREESARQAEPSLDDDDRLSNLSAELEETMKTFVDSGITFRVQGRSADWLRAVEKEIKKDVSTNGMNENDKAGEVTLHQVARSITVPAGITVEHLRQIREVAGAQYSMLTGAFFAACSQAPTVSVPTSPTSSNSRGGRRR